MSDHTAVASAASQTVTLPSYTQLEQAADSATIAYAAFHDLDTLFQAILALSEPDSLVHKLAVAGRHIAEDHANICDCDRGELEAAREVVA